MDDPEFARDEIVKKELESLTEISLIVCREENTDGRRLAV